MNDYDRVYEHWISRLNIEDQQAEQHQKRLSNLLNQAMVFSMFLMFGGALFLSLNSSLNSMTRHDCEVNKIQAACEELKK